MIFFLLPTVWGRGLAVAALLGVLAFTSSVTHAQDEDDAESASGVTTPTPAPKPTASPVDEALKELENNQSAIAAKKQEIAELDAQIQNLSARRNTTQAAATLVAQKITRLRQQLEKAELELKQTQLNIHVVRRDQQSTESEIEQLQILIGIKRQQLKTIIRSLHTHEHQSLITILFSTGSLSETLKHRSTYIHLQAEQADILQDIRHREQTLQEKQTALDQQEEDLGNLQELLEVQQQNLAGDRREHERFLRAKQAEQVAYEHQLAEARAARREIEQDVFTLKNAGITLKLTEAKDIARYASKLTGVRAALLLGVLKVETNLGSNIGSGVFPDDMHPGSREAFVRITQKLGLDPHKAPISARPRSYQGWGGAMGPGQIMPATWETIEARVGQLMNKAQPNPYELTDAFVATAIFLADRGAAQATGEYEAVNRYLAGPNWQRFTWYGDRVLAVAKEYEKEGL